MKYKPGSFITVPNIESLSGKAKELQVLFMWICSFSNKNGQCWPSRKTLAEKSNLGTRTLDKYMRELENLGFLKKEIRKTEAKNLTNIYQIMIIGGVEQGSLQGEARSRVEQGSLQGSAPVALGVERQNAQELNSILTKHNLTKKDTLLKEPDPVEKEINMVAEMFSELNKDYHAFFKPGVHRSSLKKIITFAKEDSIDVRELIRLAKESHGVQYEPQIFTPADMVAKYSKLLATRKKNQQHKSDPSIPYKKGKYSNDRSLEVKI